MIKYQEFSKLIPIGLKWPMDYRIVSMIDQIDQ